MVRFIIIFVVVAVAFWVFSIVDAAVRDASQMRGVSKPAWIVILVLLPVLGGILWFLVGRGRAKPRVAPLPPDDDPRFFRSLSEVRDRDERIRQLEEELARLEDEDDQPERPN